MTFAIACFYMNRQEVRFPQMSISAVDPFFNFFFPLNETEDQDYVLSVPDSLRPHGLQPTRLLCP